VKKFIHRLMALSGMLSSWGIGLIGGAYLAETRGVKVPADVRGLLDGVGVWCLAGLVILFGMFAAVVVEAVTGREPE